MSDPAENFGMIDPERDGAPPEPKAPAQRNWRYCVAGNMKKTHLDEQGVLRYGSSAFSGGTKLYLYGKYWGKGEREICVIGLCRGKRYFVGDVPVSLIENVRCGRVFTPAVLNMMDDWEFRDGWWGRSAEDRAAVKKFAADWQEGEPERAESL